MKRYCCWFLLMLLSVAASAQDWVRGGTNLGVEKVRVASADFKPSTQDAKNADLLKTFNETLWNDLDNAGIFDLVSKSFYPLQAPGQPSEVNFTAWSSPPPNAARCPPHADNRWPTITASGSSDG